MADREVAEIQREIVAEQQAKAIVDQRKNARDIRDRIARSGQYDPDKDPDYIYQPYPKWVDTPNGRMVVQNKDEHQRVLGLSVVKPEPVEVDVASLAQVEEPTAPRRGRPPKAKTETILPPNID